MQNTIRYAAGDWYLVARERGFALLPNSVQIALLEAVWDTLQEGTLASVIDALTSASGMSLSTIPPFVVAIEEAEDLRLAVRGGVRVAYDDGVHQDLITGGRVQTWVEQAIPPYASIVVTPPEARIEELMLPVASGVVRTGLVTIGNSEVTPPDAVAQRRRRRRKDADGVADLEQDDAVTDEELDALASVSTAAGDEVVGEAEQIVDDVADLSGVESAAASAAAAADAEAAAIVNAEAAAAVDAVAAKDAASAVETPAAAQEPAGDAQGAEGALEQVEEAAGATEGKKEPDAPQAEQEGGDAPGGVAPAAAPVRPPSKPRAKSAAKRPSAATEQSGSAAGASSTKAAAQRPAKRPSPPAEGELSASEVDAAFEAIRERELEVASGGDHDGNTVEQPPARPERGAEQDGAVLQEPTPVAESVGRAVLSTGRVLALDRVLVLGRRPRVTRTAGGVVPALIAVESPTHDISRNHIEIRRDGDSVLVTDLNTTNGTVLLRGTEPPRRLHPGEATLIISGDVVDIGDEVTVSFEDLP